VFRVDGVGDRRRFGSMAEAVETLIGILSGASEVGD
jgi:hypothetical protein